MGRVEVQLTPLGSAKIRRLLDESARRALEQLYPELEVVLRAKPATTTERAYFTAELEGDE